MLDTANDEDVLDPAGHVQAVTTDHADVAAAEEPSAIAPGESRAECRQRGLRLVPVPGCDARPADPDLARCSRFAFAIGLRIHDADISPGRRRAARDRRTTPGGNQQRCFRKPVRRAERAGLEPAAAERLAERIERCLPNRLRAVECKVPCAESQTVALLRGHPAED